MTVREFFPQSTPKPPLSHWESERRQAFLNDLHRPLALEIGCGVGFHPLKHSLSHPEINLIAIEQTTEKFQKFYRRFLNHGKPENLLPLHADAKLWTAHYLPRRSLSECFLLYPNPHPKNQQAHLRWIRSPYMGYLFQLLKPGAKLTMATNELFYYEEYCEHFTHWGFQLVSRAFYEQGDITPRTHFEKKYLARGQKVYEVILMKPHEAQ